MDKRYTKEGLPIVSIDTLATFGKDMISRTPDYVGEWIKDIDKENPGVSAYMNVTVATLCPPEHRDNMYSAIAGLYKILKNQAQINSLESHLD